FLAGRHRAAVEVYKEVMRIGKDDWITHHNRALCYAFLKDSEKASTAFQTSLKLCPTIESYVAFGDMLLLRDEAELAVGVFEEGLELDKTNLDILIRLGRLYLTYRKDVEKARDVFEMVLEREPRNNEALKSISAIHILNHSHVAALVKYRALASTTTLTRTNLATLYNDLGMSFYSQSKFNLALPLLLKSLALQPLNAQIHHNLGLVHLHTSQFASAIKYFETAAKLNPKRGETYLWLGVAYFNAGMGERAERVLETGVRVDGYVQVAHISDLLKLNKYNRLMVFFCSFAVAIPGRVQSYA
ncbi:Bardet-Biedl syndrome 4 protein, partial [Rhizophlyctis rosea]